MSALPAIELQTESLGDSAAVIRFRCGERWIEDPLLLAGIVDRIREAPEPGIQDAAQASGSITVYFDSVRCTELAVCNALRTILHDVDQWSPRRPRRIEIPVCYDNELALDLQALSVQLNLPAQEIIRLHSSAEYQVRMLGFAPGFPYLSGLPARLRTDRRTSPRARVPAGSVAIAADQTGIYPVDSPGGWHVIGRTPLTLFNHRINPPALLRAGDAVCFIPLTLSEFRLMSGGATDG